MCILIEKISDSSISSDGSESESIGESSFSTSDTSSDSESETSNSNSNSDNDDSMSSSSSTTSQEQLELAIAISKSLLNNSPFPSAGSGKKIKCKSCKKKIISGMEYKCRCDEVYCTRCRMPEDHVCSFDWKTFQKEKLKKDNPVVQDAKIEKID